MTSSVVALVILLLAAWAACGGEAASFGGGVGGGSGSGSGSVGDDSAFEKNRHLIDDYEERNIQNHYSVSPMSGGRPGGVRSVSNFQEETLIQKFLREGFLSKVQTQTIVNESLVIGGYTVSFHDSKLTPYKLHADGSYSHVYTVDADENLLVRVLKRDGFVKSVTCLVLSTGESFHALPLAGKPDGVYAVYSTKDTYAEAFPDFQIDESGVKLPSPYEQRLINLSNGQGDILIASAGNDPEQDDSGNNATTTDGGRRHLQTACSELTVIRVHIIYDARFCLDNGGRQGAEDKIAALVTEANIPYNGAPLCLKVETCRVSGSCDETDDPIRERVIDPATSHCTGPTGMLDLMRNYMGQSRSRNYRNNECDATHLFFGDSRDDFPDNGSLGCAWIGSFCHSGMYGIGVNQMGVRRGNFWTQAALFEHELGHNMGGKHDDDEGYVMFRSICRECTSFSPASNAAIIDNLSRVDRRVCLEDGGAASTTRRPTPAPTQATIRATLPPRRTVTRPPTRRPTRSPTRRPTRSPTRRPTRSPTRRPTRSPTRRPTRSPTRSPTRAPAPTCDNRNVISNSSFNSGSSSGWMRRSARSVRIVSPGFGNSGYAFQMNQGTSMIEVDDNCFRAGDRYEMRARFRLLNRSGNPIACTVGSGDVPCPHMALQSFARNGDRHYTIVEALGRQSASGWNEIIGYATITDATATATLTRVFFGGYSQDGSLIIDNVEMKRVPQQCNNVVPFGDMRYGSADIWNSYGDGVYVRDHSPGVGRSGLAVRFSGRDSNWKGMEVDFRKFGDMRCLQRKGQTWEMKAQIRLLRSDNGRAARCNTRASSDCPLFHAQFVNESGRSVPLTFSRMTWPRTWDPNDFNEIRGTVAVPNSGFRSISSVKLIIRGGNIRYDYIVDNVSMRPL